MLEQKKESPYAVTRGVTDAQAEALAKKILAKVSVMGGVREPKPEVIAEVAKLIKEELR